MTSPEISYFVFDIESVADGQLVSSIRYPGENLDGEEAIARYRAELMEKYESDFIPYTYQVPVSVAIAKIDPQFALVDLVVLDEPQFRPHVITDLFWRGWRHYGQPTLVSFNGRGFDMPLLELAAFRYGLPIPQWFVSSSKSWEQPRNRYNQSAHLDLHDVLTNFGAARFRGGLNLAANVLGKPGKMDVEGHMVQDLYGEGKLQEINNYCRCDVLDTYFVFLRTQVLYGRLDLSTEQQLVDHAKGWLSDRAEGNQAYQTYLAEWGNWQNPWESDGA